MNTHVFKITAKTNLHVGNESGGDFTIIDKAIQRDPLTGLPCINSSSLKGAINEYCCNVLKWNEDDLIRLFGSDKGKRKNDTQKGEAIFFDARLLLMPQQDDNTLYHYVTTQDIVRMMNERIALLGSTIKFQLPTQYPEGPEAKKVIPIEVKDMEKICSDDNLPIIARNVLENGESKNLWYEQVLPAETVLYTIIQEKENVIKEKDNMLANNLDGAIIQIGANATIGYGYCKFELIK